ncbi:hypothetical protein K458DRAFT_389869 [Lentithecium fluviatile CBS 122367]|uniref:Uncharacterized protein n=1 Tax=Lentithecium fluviatile CBS 122367 TaxID=1168545 RepID=A0A6G1IYD8_9PLEO|nr:hypothetical protein K458DRAFT_389869 [Lentithecium fluviatile CBS 122367]
MKPLSVPDSQLFARPIIYNQILALGGRELDVVEKILPIGFGSWHTLLARLWFIEHHSIRCNLMPWGHSSGSFAKPLHLHNSIVLSDWAFISKEAQAVTFFQDDLTIPKYIGILFRQMKEPLYQLRTLTDLWKAPLDLLGAAVFDLGNFDSQLRHLHAPSQPLGYNVVVENIVDSQLYRLMDLTPVDPPSPVDLPSPDNSASASPMSGLGIQSYGRLQSLVADCDSVILLENARVPLLVRKRNDELYKIVYSVICELVKEDWKTLEDLENLQRRVFKFC